MNHLNTIEQDFIANINHDTPAQRIDRIHDAINSTLSFYNSYSDTFCFDSNIVGDINCDNDVNVLDVQTILNLALNHPVATNSQLNIVDYDNDEDITVLDIIFLIRQILDA